MGHSQIVNGIPVFDVGSAAARTVTVFPRSCNVCGRQIKPRSTVGLVMLDGERNILCGLCMAIFELEGIERGMNDRAALEMTRKWVRGAESGGE
jgi:hypothetical protein